MNSEAMLAAVREWMAAESELRKRPKDELASRRWVDARRTIFELIEEMGR